MRNTYPVKYSLFIKFDRLNKIEPIKFIEITDDNIVNVELQGACGTCPYSTMTLKNGVEASVKKALPEIKSVEAINLNQ